MNQKIRLQPMDRVLLHEYYKGFVMDADIFMDMSNFREYTYVPERVDAYFDNDGNATILNISILYLESVIVKNRISKKFRK